MYEQLEKGLGGRSSLQGTAEEMDKQFWDLVTALAPNLPPPDPDVKREDKTVDGVPVRIYTPQGSGKKPVGIYVSVLSYRAMGPHLQGGHMID